MAYANGRIPASALAPIPGRNAGLLKAAAARWKALHYYSLAHGGPALTIIDGSVGRAYRSYKRQLLAKRVYGSNAATPGTSNHGLGLAVDLMTQAQRRAVDRWGARFGLAKRWSDAAWEWWHIKTRLDVGTAYRKPDPLRALGPRQRAAARRLLYHRREMAAARRAGATRRQNKNLKHARSWKRRVATYRDRARGRQRTVLQQVLNATTGRL